MDGLETAMVIKDNEKLSLLLQKGFSVENVNTVNADGETPLYAAIGMNCGLKIVRALLSAKAEVNAKNVTGETPLFAAAKIGDLAIVEELLAAGADTNMSRCSALYEAVSSGKDVSLVRALLEAGADVSYRRGRNNMLHVVCETETAKELLSRGLEVNAKNNFDETPLFTAIKKAVDIGVIQALLEGGADVSARNMNDETPIFAAVEKGNLLVVKTLVLAGSSVNITNDFNETPLYKAVLSGRAEIVEVLLANGSNLNSRRDDTLLHLASKLPIVCQLLRYGINVNAKNKCGQTALHFNVWGVHKKERNRLAIVRELLRYGADVNSIDIKGNTPLHYALVHLRICRGKLGVIELLVENGADINITNTKQSFPVPFGSPFCFTINAEEMECTELLIRVALFRKNYSDLSEIITFNSSFPPSRVPYKLIKYFSECIQELTNMKRVIMSNNRNLYDFIMFDYPKNIEKLYQEYNYINKCLLHQYPIYQSTIMAKMNICIEKAQRLFTFRQLQIAAMTTCRKKLIFLNYDCIEKLSGYLTDVAVQKFLEAFNISVEISRIPIKN